MPRPPAAAETHDPTRDRVALISLSAAIVVAPQLYGGVFRWSTVLIATMGIAALGLAVAARSRSAGRVFDPLLGAMLLAWTWTVAQTLPLPRWLAEALRLESVQNVDRLQAIVDYSIPLTLSLDPGGTRAQVIVGAAILSAFVAARLLEPRHPGAVARAVALSAAFIGVSGLLHEIAGTGAVFGVYEPRFTNSRLLSPIMNNNHMGGFLTLGALVSTGIAVDGHDRRARAPWLGIAAFCALLVPWVLSRGAIGALVFGLGFLVWALRRRRGAFRPKASAFALSVAAAVGMAIFFALEPLLRRFEQQDFSKIEMAFSGLRLLEGSAWWFGVGRGAFSAAFATMEGSRLRITHPENLPVQWLTEWGVPVAVILMWLLVGAFFKRFRAIDSTTALGLFVGLLALALQNLVDFSLELPAVAFVAAASLGALMAPTNQSPPDEGAIRRRAGMLMGLFAMFVLASAVVAPSIIDGDVQVQADRLARELEHGDEAAFARTLQEALRQHPAEPVFPLLAAAESVRTDDPKAPRWLSITMMEAPGWGSPHLLAAQWLIQRGRVEQALLEIRETERRTPGAALQLVCDLLRGQGHGPGMTSLATASPDDHAIGFYDRATRCSGLDEELREAIDRHILSIEPTHPLASVRQAKRLVRRAEVAQATTLLDDALSVHPDSKPLWETLASTHLAANSPADALEVLDRAVEHGVDPDDLLASRARAYAASGDRDAMKASLTRMRGLTRGDPKKLAACLLLEGDLEASMGEVDRALAAYRAADRADLGSPALSRAAALAAREGRRNWAHLAYRDLCSREPGGFACQRRDQLARQLGASVDPK